MPTITATPLPAYGWVRVQVEWLDHPATQYAALERVDATTGAVTPIRPHTGYSGWAQQLSGSTALLYDTEAPLDTAFYYRVSDAADPDTYYSGKRLRDLFTRTVAAGSWGTVDTTGEAWGNYLSSGDLSVSAGTGRQSLGTVNVLRGAFVAVGVADQRLAVDVKVPVVPTGAAITAWVMVRATDTSNYYLAQLSIATSGAASLVLGKRVAGTLTTGLSTAAVGTHAAGDWWRVMVDVNGYTLRAKAWKPASASEPSAWQASAVDSSLTTGNLVGVGSRLESGNTNTLPVVTEWDEMNANALSPAYSTSVTLDGGGGFWLRSPLHPAKDRRLTLKPASGCPAPSAKVFVGMVDTEQYGSNSATLAPVNRRLAAYASRPRRGVESTLTVVTRTFTDRDEVLDTVSDGTALQFAAPPAYGVGTRYLGVGDVDVRRGLADHRFEPRLFALPFTEVEQPAGPATGVTGARFRDLCSTYATWDAVNAAGKTYDDMVTVS